MEAGQAGLAQAESCRGGRISAYLRGVSCTRLTVFADASWEAGRDGEVVGGHLFRNQRHHTTLWHLNTHTHTHTNSPDYSLLIDALIDCSKHRLSVRDISLWCYARPLRSRRFRRHSHCWRLSQAAVETVWMWHIEGRDSMAASPQSTAKTR